MLAPLHLDAHERPPLKIRGEYKKYLKLRAEDIDHSLDVIDFKRGLTSAQQRQIERIGVISRNDLSTHCHVFEQSEREYVLEKSSLECLSPIIDVPIYEHRGLPGLHILPSLIPPKTQLYLLSRLLHRDLSNPRHKTNIHAHYHVPYSDHSDSSQGNASFFRHPPSSSDVFLPKDQNAHKSLSMAQCLERRLRWVTLGGQYDWTKKQYPQESPPPFPPDIADFLQGVFPEMNAQAAIVNLYSPGDTLSIHRDVSEACDNGLISISLGCDCVFVVGIEIEADSGSLDEEMKQGAVDVNNPQESRKEVNMLALRLRSGDVVYMSGQARFAWHGVPKIMSDTCPEWLQSWPAPGLSESNIEGQSSFETFESWRGWMASKRINLNVRQMWQ